MDKGEIGYRRYIGGDDSGLTEIIKEYRDSLTLYINGYVRNIFVSEELMEETFFILAVKKPKFHGKSTFKTWLFSIARNVAVDYIRKNSKSAKFAIDENETLSEETDIEKDFLKNEQNITLHRCLKKLKTEYYTVLYLTYFEGFCNSETALIMKKSKRQTENLIYRAKKALKEELLKEGFEYEEL